MIYILCDVLFFFQYICNIQKCAYYILTCSFLPNKKIYRRTILSVQNAYLSQLNITYFMIYKIFKLIFNLIVANINMHNIIQLSIKEKKFMIK